MEFCPQHLGDCTTEARGDPRCWNVCVEPAWPQGEEGRARHSYPGSYHRREAEERRGAEKDITKQNTRLLVGFRNAHVFDVSQTEGAELPAMREMHGEVGENRDRLVSFIGQQGIALVFTENISPALGVSYGGRIVIVSDQGLSDKQYDNF